MLFPFDNIKSLNNFGAHFEERSSSPSFKSSILPTLKPSPEYQQTGVKAQITKFASKEKDALQNSPTNSLERRQTQKLKSVSQPIQTAVYQNTRIPFTDSASHEVPHPLQADSKFVNDNYVPFYVNEACKETDDLPISMKPSTSQGMGYHSPAYGNTGQDYVQSAVDYAKIEFKIFQQGLRDETKPRTIKNGHLVSDAKNKMGKYSKLE
ncbi:uncharacterized protein CEXT_643341 [Caerostris extrusa]|uniref:Uncharacterized protein n=1 Tax=Caerostris extrusa TaxID=172846 RepID=A0AAV4P0S4_CAEEX|nr:uncharacterized protein CEXT_643341 [Caerostris extrusa]